MHDLTQTGSIDEEFNQGSGFERIANVAAVLPDQKILVGGYYTSYNGTHTYGLARLHPDGEFDSTFFMALTQEEIFQKFCSA
ncbi:MAG: delta-60 repeat domain-containing protein [Crocinitomicaceae bacterium]|nr:delta-60 repeat domain-containing protein [Crocinitomicaceae bacterium]